jgi:hypothetical protein
MFINRLLRALLGSLLMLSAGQSALAARKASPSAPVVNRVRDARTPDLDRRKLSARRQEQESQALAQLQMRWAQWLRYHQRHGC